MGLIRTIFWFAVFVIATFAFTVLFEHGTTNYVQNAEREFSALKKQLDKKIDRKNAPSDEVAP
ncbi:MAG: hypothetical protein EOP84_21445 [Verrucomicrobiaceae bacterium]|nr:MAG: hypothetical protein EOP84_21445 [Verrucomicrobiaceae bacterium]